MQRVSPPAWFIIGMIVLLGAALLLSMGRVPICTCGYVKLWHGVTMSSENSQHLSDWYSLSHVIHGLLFYAGAWWLFRQWSFGDRLALATLVELAWEVLENTPWIIQRYREGTVSLDYFGDSVVNSVSDIAMMMVGFWLAARLPVAWSIGLALLLELVALVAIRDNLTLNVLMLLWPIEAVRDWQAGGLVNFPALLDRKAAALPALSAHGVDAVLAARALSCRFFKASHFRQLGRPRLQRILMPSFSDLAPLPTATRQWPLRRRSRSARATRSLTVMP